MKTPFLGGHICISTTLITKAHTFSSAACKLFCDREKIRQFINLNRDERENRLKTSVFLYSEDPCELKNTIGNSLTASQDALCYGVCSTIVMACHWVLFTFIPLSLCFTFIASTFQPSTLTMPAARAVNVKRKVCVWDRHSCILSNSAKGNQLVLTVCTSGRRLLPLPFWDGAKHHPALLST